MSRKGRNTKGERGIEKEQRRKEGGWCQHVTRSMSCNTRVDIMSVSRLTLVSWVSRPPPHSSWHSLG